MVTEKVIVDIEARDNATGTFQKVGASTKDLVRSFAGVATAAFSIYNAVDRVNDMQLNLSRANLKVESTTNSLKDAQLRQSRSTTDLEQAQQDLINAVAQYGEGSNEAAAANEKLKIAQENYTRAIDDTKLAEERLDVAQQNQAQTQENYTEAMVGSAIQVGVSLITLGDSVSRTIGIFKNMDGTSFATLKTSITGVTTAIQGMTVASGLALASVGALVGVAGYLGWEKGQREAVYGPGGLPPPPGQTAAQGPFGLPTLDLGKKISDWLMGAQNAIGTWWSGVTGAGRIPIMQHGGLVTEPTLALIGEAGPEAVVPLGSGSRFSSPTQYITINPTINIANVSSDVDIALLAERTSTEIMKSLRRLE